jgi:AraC-like DNA-binding protein
MMGQPPSGLDPTDPTALPGAYVLRVAEMLTPWHVSAEQVLAKRNLTVEQLAAPTSRVSLRLANELLKRAIALTGEPALGLMLGFQMKVSHHGYIGFAAMTARNIGEALRIVERFAPLRTTAVDIRLTVEGGGAAISLVFDSELEPLRQVALLAVSVGLVQMGAAATGRLLSGRAEFAFPKPAYLDRFLPMLGDYTITFDRPANRLIFDAALLEIPLVMADASSSRMVLDQCERELESLGEHARLRGRVRRVVEAVDRGAPTLEEVARHLHLSPRTLKRHLAQTGTTFRAIVDEVLEQKALLMLPRRDLSVEQVADRLGYSDVANFTRAFRRWTGRTPSAVKKGK